MAMSSYPITDLKKLPTGPFFIILVETKRESYSPPYHERDGSGSYSTEPALDVYIAQDEADLKRCILALTESKKKFSFMPVPRIGTFDIQVDVKVK